MIFIAEIGLNHNGNFGLVHELVRQAKFADADIAKFQLGWRAGEGEMNRIGKEEMDLIFRACEYYEIEPMVSIVTPEAYEFAQQYDFNRYKIASRTVQDDPALVQKIVDEGKETFISLGMWDGDGLPIEGADNIRYLYCKARYPTAPWEISELPKDFRNSPYAGFSDHTVGIETALMAITRGAGVVERHFTLDKSDTTIRDHALSTTPDEFQQMTKLGRLIERNLALGV
jgi:N,N'-diacetyllegionaminate synthase